MVQLGRSSAIEDSDSSRDRHWVSRNRTTALAHHLRVWMPTSVPIEVFEFLMVPPIHPVFGHRCAGFTAQGERNNGMAQAAGSMASRFTR